MFKHYMNQAIVYLFLGGFSCSLGTIYGDYFPAYSSPNSQSQPNNSYQQEGTPSNPRATGREEVAYEDNYYPPQYSRNQGYPNQRNAGQQYDYRNYTDPEDTSYRNHPMTDWDYKESWQYTPKEFFQGKTQPEVWREHHPYGYGGIGYDGDPEYLRLERMEQDFYKQKQLSDNSNPQNGNGGANPYTYRPNNGQNYPIGPRSNYNSNTQNGSNTQNNIKNNASGTANSNGDVAANERNKNDKKDTRVKRNRLYTNPRQTGSK